MNEEINKKEDSDTKDTTKPPVKRRKPTLLVRYGKMGQMGYFTHNIRDFPDMTTHVLVNTERGMELGEIISPQCSHKRGNCKLSNDKIDTYCKTCSPDYPIYRHGKVIRIASPDDIKEMKHIDKDCKNLLKSCNDLLREMNLPMSLVDVEHLFGGERIIYYFMAEGRVDFRQLVKQLAQQYQTRIEMRQVGARDEARLVADFETCGRECCCKSFLKVLLPVNMRMAKLQKATLDPSKISGRCGRLKCCLRYEDVVYTELKRKLPHKNSFVRLEDGYGMVINTQVITQLVKLRMPDDRIVAISVDDILEYDFKPPKDEPAKKPERSDRPNRRNDRQRDKKPQQNDRKPRQNDNKPADQAPNNGPEGQPSETEGEPVKKKRRRRRRRRKPSSDQDGNSNNQNNNNQNNNNQNNNNNQGNNNNNPPSQGPNE